MAAPVEYQEFHVDVPGNVKPGQKFCARIGRDGPLMQVDCPMNALPGMRLLVKLPVSRKKPQTDNPLLLPKPDDDAAALALRPHALNEQPKPGCSERAPANSTPEAQLPKLAEPLDCAKNKAHAVESSGTSTSAPASKDSSDASAASSASVEAREDKASYDNAREESAERKEGLRCRRKGGESGKASGGQQASETEQDVTMLAEGTGTRSWEDNFKILQAYKQRFSHVCPPAHCPVFGYKFGMWVMLQRSAANTGKLQAERLERLKALGFVFDGAKARLIREQTEQRNQYNDQGGGAVGNHSRSNPQESSRHKASSSPPEPLPRRSYGNGTTFVKQPMGAAARSPLPYLGCVFDEIPPFGSYARPVTAPPRTVHQMEMQGGGREECRRSGRARRMINYGEEVYDDIDYSTSQWKRSSEDVNDDGPAARASMHQMQHMQQPKKRGRPSHKQPGIGMHEGSRNGNTGAREGVKDMDSGYVDRGGLTEGQQFDLMDWIFRPLALAAAPHPDRLEQGFNPTPKPAEKLHGIITEVKAPERGKRGPGRAPRVRQAVVRFLGHQGALYQGTLEMDDTQPLLPGVKRPPGRPRKVDNNNFNNNGKKVFGACFECYRAHQACDRERPCASCVMRGMAHSCRGEEWEASGNDKLPKATAAAAEGSDSVALKKGPGRPRKRPLLDDDSGLSIQCIQHGCAHKCRANAQDEGRMGEEEEIGRGEQDRGGSSATSVGVNDVNDVMDSVNGSVETSNEDSVDVQSDAEGEMQVSL